jgi:hypothetical protein
MRNNAREILSQDSNPKLNGIRVLFPWQMNLCSLPQALSKADRETKTHVQKAVRGGLTRLKK